MSRLRPKLFPPQVAAEREFIVRYTTSTCHCEHCAREKTIMAFGYADASMRFQKRYPLASVISVR